MKITNQLFYKVVHSKSSKYGVHFIIHAKFLREISDLHLHSENVVLKSRLI